jgi:hypothetical protein
MVMLSALRPGCSLLPGRFLVLISVRGWVDPRVIVRLGVLGHLKHSLTSSYLLTYLRSWALLEKPPIVQPLKNFPAFYGTGRFNTLFTRALHWSLSWAISVRSTPSHPIYLRSILIFSAHLRLGLPSENYYYYYYYFSPVLACNLTLYCFSIT